MRRREAVAQSSTFRTVVVDDEPSVLSQIEACLPHSPTFQFELLTAPEQIPPYAQTEGQCDMVVLDIVYGKERKLHSALRHTRKAWPGAIVVILSNYDDDLAKKDRQEADSVLNKPTLFSDPALLCQQIVEVLSSKADLDDRVVELLRGGIELCDPVEDDVYTSRGYVLSRCADMVRVVVTDEGGIRLPQRRRLLLPYRMFADDGLDAIGTPFIFRVYPSGPRYITEVVLDAERDAVPPVPGDVEELIERVEIKKGAIRKSNKSGGKGCRGSKESSGQRPEKVERIDREKAMGGKPRKRGPGGEKRKAQQEQGKE